MLAVLIKHLDRHHLYFVVSQHPVDEVLINAALYHLRRHLERVAFDAGLDFYRHQLPWPELLAGILEVRLGADRTGGRRQPGVDQRQRTFAQQQAVGRTVALIRLDRRRSVLGDQALQGRQHLLRQGKLHGDRIDLRHRKQTLSIADAQEIAFIDVADTDSSGHR